jgi:hypothetical protein
VYFPTEPFPEAVAIGDVNGDGLKDVVMTTSSYPNPENGYYFHVFLQNASGELDLPIKYWTNSSWSNRPTSIGIGDLNNDGRNDVVVGNMASNIEVFFQNASGALNPGISFPTINSMSVKVGDLNNDGLADVVGIGSSTNSVDIFFQNRNGSLNSPITNLLTPGGYSEVEVGDVNNDGLIDIVVMNGAYATSPHIGILFQNPDGTFTAPIYYTLGGYRKANGVAVGDVNGDGLSDIVVSYGGNRPNSYIGVFLQNSLGVLNPVISYSSHDIPGSIVTADVNGDGKQDIIVAHCEWSAIGLYLQGENGALMSEELYTILNSPCSSRQALAVGNIGRDRFNDVVIAGYAGLIVLYNEEGPSVPNISVAPDSVNFGPVFLGRSSTRDVKIYNSGRVALTVNGIEIAGPDAVVFNQSNYCSTITPGNYCTVTINFNATSEGEKNATLIINSNDPDAALFSVTLFAFAGEPLFYPYVYLPVGSSSEAVAVGDVNGDGRDDVVMATSGHYDLENDYHIHVFIQSTSGELEPAVKYPTNSSETNKSTSVHIGDVNHDGRADVVVGNCGSNIEVFLQNSAGGLDSGINYANVNSCSIKIADLNNDGLLDVVGIGQGTNTVDIFFQNFSGTLNLPVTYTVTHGGYYDEVQVGDVNNDGLTDIIIINGQGTVNLAILFQTTERTFIGPIYYSLGISGQVNGGQ